MKVYTYISSLYLAHGIIDNHLTIAEILLHCILLLQYLKKTLWQGHFLKVIKVT